VKFLGWSHHHPQARARDVLHGTPTGSVRANDEHLYSAAMSVRGHLPLSDELFDYVVAHGVAPDPIVTDLMASTAALGGVARMQIGADQMAFMTLLTRLLEVRFAVEVGTFTGASSLAIARGLAPGGRLLCCDVSEEWTALARAAWSSAGVDDRIDLVIAPALDTLRALPNEPIIDLAFIDADKANYANYYDALLPRIRPNGVILVDNTLWDGRVLDMTDTTTDTAAIRAFNVKVASDDRVEATILLIGDGLSVIRKR
jgi:caffeoyl-CoA O-methyltransferase